jgi:deoxyribonuclease-1
MLVVLAACGCAPADSDSPDPPPIVLPDAAIVDAGEDAAFDARMDDPADMAPDPVMDAMVDAQPVDMAPPPTDYCAAWRPIPDARLLTEVHGELVRTYEPVGIVNDLERYTIARRWMYLNVERRDLNSGRGVQGLYTGREFQTPADRTPNPALVNTEHVTPRSELDPDRGSRRYDHQQSDIHNLYPTAPDVNMARGSVPFGEVEDVDERFGEARLGWDASGRRVFEPRAERRGDVARALMYMAARWGLGLDGVQLATARAWHQLDPVDEWEQARNAATARVQGNRNPFVDCPALAGRIAQFPSFAPIQERLP